MGLILVVDDSREEAESIARLLRGAGHATRLASNGREALEAARRERPRLVVSDIEMPVMNGYGLSREIKRDPALRSTPVMLLTPLSRPENILRALDARADFYLTKPFDHAFLLDRVRKLLAAPPSSFSSEAEEAEDEVPLEVSLGGIVHTVRAGRAQMLNLLLCTYEHAAHQSRAAQESEAQARHLNAQLQKQSADLETSRASFLSLLESSDDGMVVVDLKGLVRYANPSACDLFGRSQREFVGRSFEFLLVAGQTKEVEISRPPSSDEWTNASPVVVAELRVVETEWQGEKAYMATLRDITLRKGAEAQIREQQAHLQKANRALEALATTDALTGLKNRRAFSERLRDEVGRSARYGAPLSVLLCDVDKFKPFNDTYGHPAGDEVLRGVGRILGAGARSSDTVARYGGEEFIALLPNTDPKAARLLSERLRCSIEAYPWEKRAITVSVGVATLTPSGSSDPGLEHEAERLVQEADKALYHSKEAGRNRVTLVDLDAFRT
jgi:diguanylate cyclase (GGDEF)-like protein/PAS domain S-box-containing protein